MKVRNIYSGHAERAGPARRGVMRRACGWVAWPAVACALLLACDHAGAVDMLAPGSEYTVVLMLYGKRG
ncbi:jg10755 [Pararge aegeria aegeria]|uniref:Jg10755 protein n=1 Tax=Pararge aegeria aegeria TaxID=348720 RepID=A0A8S4RIP0_9NEOP|nr:jg10755 [Pararge aegeria aegeria]